MVRALGPRKFIEDGKWCLQGRVRGAKIACFRNLENEEFWRATLAEGTCLNFFGPAGGSATRKVLRPQGYIPYDS